MVLIYTKMINYLFEKMNQIFHIQYLIIIIYFNLYVIIRIINIINFKFIYIFIISNKYRILIYYFIYYIYKFISIYIINL